MTEKSGCRAITVRKDAQVQEPRVRGFRRAQEAEARWRWPGWCVHSEELETACGDYSLRDLGGKEDERTVVLGEAELNNEIFAMEGNEYFFRLS